MKLGMDMEAKRDYINNVMENLDKGRTFSAAYYLKELVENKLIETLFEAALKESIEENDLW